MPGADEYGDVGRAIGNKWATMDTVLPQQDLHIHDTRVGAGGRLTFYLYPPRPAGLSVEEWDAVRQDKWDRIFGKKSEETR
jgi:hypothetical protein